MITLLELKTVIRVALRRGPCGLMDKASVSGTEDCGFESHQGRNI